MILLVPFLLDAEAEATAAGGVGTTDGGGASSRPTTASVIDLDGVNVAATLDAQELGFDCGSCACSCC